MRPRRAIPTSALLIAIASVAACNSTDPQLKVLQERARWDVRILSWAQEADGPINVATRISGPPASSLEQLTVRFDLLGGSDEPLGSHWHTYDLADVPRGGPSDLLVRVPGHEVAVEGLAVSLVLQPNADDQSRMPELAPRAPTDQ
jgi:hypothetical protein